MLKRNYIVTKMSGEQVPFNPDKLLTSLKRSGASDEVISNVISKVEESLFEGISTKKIYQLAFNLLKKQSRPIAARYKLKKALLEFGPTGYPFEKYISAILSYQSYQTSVGKIIQGHCISHEVDVLAEKGDETLFVECKFHSNQKRTCDVKVPLYIQSRVVDLQKQWTKVNPTKTQGWIVTNTRFTKDALQYGNCAGLVLIGWDYPKKGSLRERIDLSGLHPITCITTLTKREKTFLLNEEIVLVKELPGKKDLLYKIGISPKRQQAIFKEIESLISE